jgi:hypothetical protein
MEDTIEYLRKYNEWRRGTHPGFAVMSDTPETDAAQFGTGRVSVDFARRLERERDEAQGQTNSRRKRNDQF